MSGNTGVWKRLPITFIDDKNLFRRDRVNIGEQTLNEYDEVKIYLLRNKVGKYIFG